jgi:NAD(P)-dependent dehydrogenase (short-subunit alcohol dehydrogenase family)
MDLNLSGHTAVVAGGASGIGRAIAAAFAQEKANVAVLDVNPAAGEVAAELTRSHGVRGLGVTVDVTDFEAVLRAAAKIHLELGRIDHIVFAVAVGSGKFGFPFLNLEPGDWKRVLEVNLLGAVHVAHAFSPALAQARSGTILFLASVAGQVGSQTDPPYSASKAALINFGQCAARDLAEYGVRVNTICPGMVKTPLNQSVWEAWNCRQPDHAKQTYEEWAAEKIRRLVPLGRWQQPEDVAAMAVFLASGLAGNITGQTINVDGGYVMHW